VWLLNINYRKERKNNKNIKCENLQTAVATLFIRDGGDDGGGEGERDVVKTS
jgi:hypothetical protein